MMSETTKRLDRAVRALDDAELVGAGAAYAEGAAHPQAAASLRRLYASVTSLLGREHARRRGDPVDGTADAAAVAREVAALEPRALDALLVTFVWQQTWAQAPSEALAGFSAALLALLDEEARLRSAPLN